VIHKWTLFLALCCNDVRCTLIAMASQASSKVDEAGTCDRIDADFTQSLDGKHCRPEKLKSILRERKRKGQQKPGSWWSLLEVKTELSTVLKKDVDGNMVEYRQERMLLQCSIEECKRTDMDPEDPR
jgi:hypothetical protein